MLITGIRPAVLYGLFDSLTGCLIGRSRGRGWPSLQIDGLDGALGYSYMYCWAGPTGFDLAAGLWRPGLAWQLVCADLAWQ